VRQTPLTHSFCQYVTASGSPFIVSDSRLHPLTQDSLAITENNVIAYAGVPLTDAHGFPLGALCAVDSQPREWTDDELAILQTLAAQVMSEIELRTHSRKLKRDFMSLQALEAEREALTQLTVHDLRTPLTALSMGLQMLPHLGSLNEAQLSSLTMLHRASDILQKLINDVLDIGRLEHEGNDALVWEECAPVDLINRACEFTRVLATEKNIQLDSWVPSDMPKIRADAERITRVLVNLIANSVKYTPRGGQIMVMVDAPADPQAQVTFSVKDTGIGIASENLKRIFDRGVRLDVKAPTAHSAGLGLTFCKRIIDAHGGHVWVESVPGEGSTFFFSVPAAGS
jgi:signal transduction histidine kinase